MTARTRGSRAAADELTADDDHLRWQNLPSMLRQAAILAAAGVVCTAVGPVLGLVRAAPPAGYSALPLLLLLAALPLLVAGGLLARGRADTGVMVLVAVAATVPGRLAMDLQFVTDAVGAARPEITVPTSLTQLSAGAGLWVLLIGHIAVLAGGLLVAVAVLVDSGSDSDAEALASPLTFGPARTLPLRRRAFGLATLLVPAAAVGLLAAPMHSTNAFQPVHDVFSSPTPVALGMALLALGVAATMLWAAVDDRGRVSSGLFLGLLCGVAAVAVPPVVAGLVMDDIEVGVGSLVALVAVAALALADRLPGRAANADVDAPAPAWPSAMAGVPEKPGSTDSADSSDDSDATSSTASTTRVEAARSARPVAKARRDRAVVARIDPERPGVSARSGSPRDRRPDRGPGRRDGRGADRRADSDLTAEPDRRRPDLVLGVLGLLCAAAVLIAGTATLLDANFGADRVTVPVSALSWPVGVLVALLAIGVLVPAGRLVRPALGVVLVTVPVVAFAGLDAVLAAADGASAFRQSLGSLNPGLVAVLGGQAGGPDVGEFAGVDPGLGFWLLLIAVPLAATATVAVVVAGGAERDEVDVSAPRANVVLTVTGLLTAVLAALGFGLPTITAPDYTGAGIWTGLRVASAGLVLALLVVAAVSLLAPYCRPARAAALLAGVAAVCAVRALELPLTGGGLPGASAAAGTWFAAAAAAVSVVGAVVASTAGPRTDEQVGERAADSGR